MTNYADFLLNELVGTSGLDFEQATDVIHRIEELREVQEELETAEA